MRLTCQTYVGSCLPPVSARSTRS